MLKETIDVRQIDGESKRRWFSSNDLELIIWLDEQDRITGFQLCYEDQGNQKAITWKENSGYSHDNIDDGENISGDNKYKATPILVADGIFNKIKVASYFKEKSNAIDKNVFEFVYDKIINYEETL